MKKVATTSFSVLILFCSYSQNEKIDKEIRQLEEKRISAFRTKDTAAMLNIWASDYFVNRPAGIVSTRDQVLRMVLTDTISFSSISFEIEKIVVKTNFVVVMGNETVTPSGNNPNADRILKRRYTHIWSRENGNWRLTARHANVLCE